MKQLQLVALVSFQVVLMYKTTKSSSNGNKTVALLLVPQIATGTIKFKANITNLIWLSFPFRENEANITMRKKT